MKRAPLIAISGGGRVLAKPFTIQQILGTIDELLGS